MRVLVGYDLSQMMHTDQQLILHRPVQVGNRLDCEVCLESFRQMGGTDIIVTKNLITDQHEDRWPPPAPHSSPAPAGWPIRNWPGWSPR